MKELPLEEGDIESEIQWTGDDLLRGKLVEVVKVQKNSKAAKVELFKVGDIFQVLEVRQAHRFPGGKWTPWAYPLKVRIPEERRHLITEKRADREFAYLALDEIKLITKV